MTNRHERYHLAMVRGLRDFLGGDTIAREVPSISTTTRTSARSAAKRYAYMKFGEAFKLAATLWALGDRRRGGSLRRPWTEGRLLGAYAAVGCDAAFIK